MFCHVTLKLGGQKDFRFHCHALIPVKFGLQNQLFKFIFMLQFVLDMKIVLVLAFLEISFEKYTGFNDILIN